MASLDTWATFPGKALSCVRKPGFSPRPKRASVPYSGAVRGDQCAESVFAFPGQTRLGGAQALGGRCLVHLQRADDLGMSQVLLQGKGLLRGESEPEGPLSSPFYQGRWVPESGRGWAGNEDRCHATGPHVASCGEEAITKVRATEANFRGRSVFGEHGPRWTGPLG